MKSKKIFLIISLIITGISIFLLSSCNKVVSDKSEIFDQVVKPHSIIYHLKSKDLSIPKGDEFNQIVLLINKRLKNAKIKSIGQWADCDATSNLSDIDTLEFQYSKLQTSSFTYVGPYSQPLHKSALSYNLKTEIRYNKLVFPLADKTDESGTGNHYSLSVFSFGDTKVKTIVNGKDTPTAFRNSPIGSLDTLTDYLKSIQG